MNLQMSEGLQLKSRGFPFKGGTGRGRAPEGPRAPVSTVRICVKCAGTATRHGCDPANYPQNLAGGGAVYASSAGKGVPQEEHHGVAIGRLTDWDVARFFWK